MPQARRIHQIPPADRPREKMQARGAQALSDFELLEVFIGSGSPGADVGYIARQIHKAMERYGLQLHLEQLVAIKGINKITAGKIISILELTRRHLLRDNQPLRSQQDIVGRLEHIRHKQQEYFVVLSLDGGQRLIAQRTITIGTLDTVLAHPREVFADAIADRAAGIVAAHNHPSGDVHPSQKDIKLTQQLVAAGQLLGIELRDHIILTKNEHFSCRQHHML